MKHFDLARVIKNPGFSTVNRKGWVGVIICRKDEMGHFYWSIQDKLGVSWPVEKDSDVEIIDNLVPMLVELERVSE